MSEIQKLAKNFWKRNCVLGKPSCSEEASCEWLLQLQHPQTKTARLQNIRKRWGPSKWKNTLDFLLINVWIVPRFDKLHRLKAKRPRPSLLPSHVRVNSNPQICACKDIHTICCGVEERNGCGLLIKLAFYKFCCESKLVLSISCRM